MSGISHLWVRPWIIIESRRLVNKAVFSHVNLCSCQCNLQTRLQKYSTENNLVAQLAVGNSEPVRSATRISAQSLAEISKPVPFNTHQLVCRLQCKGVYTACDMHLYSHEIM